MTKVIVEGSKKKQEVYNGQIRTNEGGRIVMSDEKIIEKYPKVLSATITITEEE